MKINEAQVSELTILTSWLLSCTTEIDSTFSAVAQTAFAIGTNDEVATSQQQKGFWLQRDVQIEVEVMHQTERSTSSHF